MSNLVLTSSLLNVNEREKIRRAIDKVEKIETALEPKFQDYFVDAMKFPTAEPAPKDSGRRRSRNRS